MSAETALEQKRLARHNLLLACKIQSLPITLLSGNLNEISEVQVGHKEQNCLFWITILTQSDLSSNNPILKDKCNKLSCKNLHIRVMKTELNFEKLQKWKDFMC